MRFSGSGLPAGPSARSLKPEEVPVVPRGFFLASGLSSFWISLLTSSFSMPLFVSRYVSVFSSVAGSGMSRATP